MYHWPGVIQAYLREPTPSVLSGTVTALTFAHVPFVIFQNSNDTDATPPGRPPDGTGRTVAVYVSTKPALTVFVPVHSGRRRTRLRTFTVVTFEVPAPAVASPAKTILYVPLKRGEYCLTAFPVESVVPVRMLTYWPWSIGESRWTV